MVSRRMNLIPPSGTIEMFEKAGSLERMGRRVLHLEVGEPDFDTPEHIKRAAYEAMKRGFTHYTSSRGIPELREAISEYVREWKGFEADPDREIIVTPGTKHAIYCACMALLNPGDEVILLSPIWTTFFACVRAAEAIPVELHAPWGCWFDEEELKEKISDRTRMIIVNSPNNPTGGALDADCVKAIADLAEDHGITVLSDEIYSRIVYDGFRQVSPASLIGVEHTVTVDGFSKTYAMTGWRLGYAIASREVVDAMVRLQQATTTCPASFVQAAAVEALRSSQECVEEMVREYDRRRRMLVERLSRIPGIRCEKPRGAFYVFPDVSAAGKPSRQVVMELLETEGVCTTPGSVFGRLGEGHIRISYATSMQTLSEALDRIEEYFENLLSQ